MNDLIDIPEIFHRIPYHNTSYLDNLVAHGPQITTYICLLKLGKLINLAVFYRQQRHVVFTPRIKPSPELLEEMCNVYVDVFNRMADKINRENVDKTFYNNLIHIIFVILCPAQCFFFIPMPTVIFDLFAQFLYHKPNVHNMLNVYYTSGVGDCPFVYNVPDVYDGPYVYVISGVYVKIQRHFISYAQQTLRYGESNDNIIAILKKSKIDFVQFDSYCRKVNEYYTIDENVDKLVVAEKLQKIKNGVFSCLTIKPARK